MTKDIKETPEIFVYDILESTKVKKHGEYPTKIFYMKGNKIYFEYDIKSKSCNVRLYVWRTLQRKYKLCIDDICDILKDVLFDKSGFKVKGFDIYYEPYCEKMENNIIREALFNLPY